MSEQSTPSARLLAFVRDAYDRLEKAGASEMARYESGRGLYADGVSCRFPNVMLDLLGADVTYIDEVVSSAPWSDAGGFDDYHVVYIDGLVLSITHGVRDDGSDATLSILVGDADESSAAQIMSALARSGGMSAFREYADNLGKYAPEEVISALRGSCEAILPTVIDGVDVSAFLAKLAAQLAEAGGKRMVARFDEAITTSGIRAAAFARKQAEEQAALQAAGVLERMAAIDATLARQPPMF